MEAHHYLRFHSLSVRRFGMWRSCRTGVGGAARLDSGGFQGGCAGPLAELGTGAAARCLLLHQPTLRPCPADHLEQHDPLLPRQVRLAHANALQLQNRAPVKPNSLLVPNMGNTGIDKAQAIGLSSTIENDREWSQLQEWTFEPSGPD